MQEFSRLSYLQAMGVINYMPRWQLPGAPVSRLNTAIGGPLPLATAAAASIPTAESVNAPNPLQTTTAAAGLVDAEPTVDDAPEPTVGNDATVDTSALAFNVAKDAPKAVAANRPQTTKKSSPAIKFSLSFWRVAEELMVVDSRHSELALPVERLLLNILVALGYPRQLPAVEVINWPMIEAHHHDQSESDARETLNSFLDEKFLLNPGKHLLLMGSDASRYLLPQALAEDDVLGKSFAITEFDLTATVVPSLSDMLLDPVQKRITWSAIRHLRQ